MLGSATLPHYPNSNVVHAICVPLHFHIYIVFSPSF